MSKSVPKKQTIDEVLKEIGYNDSPLRREAKQAFAKWLQHFIVPYGDFPNKQAFQKADIINKFIADRLKELNKP